MDQVKVGVFLASLRKEKGLTQEALAERIGVTNKTISRWETGTYMPDVEMLLILGEQFNVTVNELLCGERLSDEAIRTKSESNIKYLAATNKKRIRKICLIAMVAVLCVTLLWLSAFSVYFVVNRRAMLYPNGTSDRNNAKRYMGEYTIASSSVPSTAYQYVNAIEKVRAWEGFSYAEIDENIDELCREYDVGGSNEELGAIGHRTIINALKKYRIFLQSK